MNLGKVVRADFGSDVTIKAEYSLRERVTGFLTLVTPIFMLMTPFNAASAAVLSIGGYPSWQLCLAGFITAALAVAGVNIFNRYADRERDRIFWPWRAIPTGRVKANHALALVIVCYILSLILCWSYFNPTAFYILLAAIVLGSLYSLYLRDRVGYLTAPIVEGLIFLCGWAALAPDTVFTTLLPWYLYLMGVVWQSAHIMVHYILHISYDSAGKPLIETPAFLWKPSPQAASYIAMGLTVALFVMGLLLPLFARLSYLYIAIVLAAGIYTINRGLASLKESTNKEKLHKAWGALSLSRFSISCAILLSVLVFP